MRGRRIAIAAGVLATATVGGTILFEFDRIAEGWWIQKLLSPDEAVRHHAAGRLGEMRSLRAAPAIIRAIGRDPGEIAIEEGTFYFFAPDLLRSGIPQGAKK